MKTFDEYRTALAAMTLGDAVSLLTDLGGLTEKIIVSDDMGSFTTNVFDFCAGIPAICLAASIGPFSFYGGPPDTYFWIRGTLMDFVMDKLMHREQENKTYGAPIPSITNLGETPRGTASEHPRSAGQVRIQCS